MNTSSKIDIMFLRLGLGAVQASDPDLSPHQLKVRCPSVEDLKEKSKGNKQQDKRLKKKAPPHELITFLGGLFSLSPQKCQQSGP